MVEIDEQVLINLQRSVSDLQSQVNELQNFRDQHVGFDYGYSGVGFPHPVQKLNMLEGAAGNYRMDRSGLQLNGGSPTGTIGALRVLNGFYIPVDLNRSFPPAGTYGLSLEAYIRGNDNMYWVFGSSDDISTGLNNTVAANAFSVIESFITTNRVSTSLQAMDRRNASGMLQAYVKVESVNVAPVYNAVWVTHAPLVLDPVNADYAYIATVGNGAIWHRFDLNKLRAYLAGVVENLAVESWVTANMQAIARYDKDLLLMGA